MKNHSANGADDGSDIGSGAMEEYEDVRQGAWILQQRGRSDLQCIHVTDLSSSAEIQSRKVPTESPRLPFSPQINFPTEG